MRVGRRLAVCPACHWLVRVTPWGQVAEHTVVYPFAGGSWERVCAGSGADA